VGWAAITGEPDGPPVKTGLSLVDYAAGLMAALALMIGIFDAARTGRGRDVDTNLYDAALALIAYPATWYLTRNILMERQPLSGHPSIVPFQFFQTQDGYLVVACAKEKFVRTLLQQLQLPDASRDPRFFSYEASWSALERLPAPESPDRRCAGIKAARRVTEPAAVSRCVPCADRHRSGDRACRSPSATIDVAFLARLIEHSSNRRRNL
jgi:crotonobetainyl-CoA:carnitine CoA-transferase CaiB-like acyl-CoA transferase